MRILVVDAHQDLLEFTIRELREDGHSVVGAASGQDARAELDRAFYDLALLDLQLPDDNALNILPRMLDDNPSLDVVVITPPDGMQTAVEALRFGAMDWITAPFTSEQIRTLLNRINKNRKLRSRLNELEFQVGSDLPPFSFDSSNPVMTGALEVAAKAANSSASILLQGENGTGKSAFARFVHQNSNQKDYPFVTVSCPSLSPQLLASELFGHVKGAFTGAVKDTWGKVAQADEGTLFLDEIGELSLDLQPRLLRLLQEREYERLGETQTHQANVRLIAATNLDLEAAVASGVFREDLYYRLNVISLTMPPLRERPGDIVQLANSFLQFFAKQCRKQVKGFSAKADRALLNYTWPGNLRELRNYVERAVIMTESELIQLEDLPSKLGPKKRSSKQGLGVGDQISLETLEKEHIKQICSRASTKEEAARILGIDPATLYRKRRRFNL